MSTSDQTNVQESGRPLLQVRGLRKVYPGVVALGGVDFDVHAGQVHALLGQNGAGKSTLIKCVSGVVEPTEGQILFEGEPLPVGAPSKSLERGIGTIYQELDLVGDLTVADNVFLGHEPRKGRLLDRKAMATRTREILQRLGHGELDPGARVGALKPAGQQLVAIARALSRDVRLLIMDEPSAILDDREVETLFAVVRRLAGEGVGIIYISHRLEEIAQIADTVTVLRNGETVAQELPPDSPAGDFVTHMVGQKLDALFPDRPAAMGDVVLEVRNLQAPPLVRDVSFDLRAGEVLGIAGLVGSGRTEMLRLIYGLDRPAGGSVMVGGQPLRANRPDVAIGAGLGMAPEERKSQALLLDWNLVANTTLADLRRFRRGGRIDRRAERREAVVHLDELNTQPPNPMRIARLLSGGNQQKVVLARWLLRKCKVLLLDEPTRGVDAGAKSEIYRVIAQLAENGLGVVVVSSELPELVGFCTRILVMREGRLVGEVAGDQATESDLLALAVGSHPTGEAA